jgi:hypothetical protein
MDVPVRKSISLEVPHEQVNHRAFACRQNHPVWSLNVDSPNQHLF